MKLLKTIRFDKSDLNVFRNPANEGEWAISGAFEFSNEIEKNLIGKKKQEFSNGFLGLTSYGRSTFASISSLSKIEKKNLVNKLAEYFVTNYGAPDIASAIPVANDEINFMIDMCKDQSFGSVLAVRRSFKEDKIHEEYRFFEKKDSCASQKIWTTIEEDDL